MNTNMTIILKEKETKTSVAKNLDIISIEFDPLSTIVGTMEKIDENDYRLRRKIEMPESNDKITKYGNLVPDVIKEHMFFKNVWRIEDIKMMVSKELLDSTVDSTINLNTDGFIFRKDIRISKTHYVDFILYCESVDLLYVLSSKIFDKNFGHMLCNYIKIDNDHIEWIDLNIIQNDMINIINENYINGKMNYGYDACIYYDRTANLLPNGLCCSTKLPLKYYTIKSKYHKNGLASCYIHHEGGLLRKIFRR